MEPKLVTRGLSGAVLGAWVGFIYGVFSTNINILVIRDLPLRHDTAAMLNNTLEALAVAAVLGIVVNIPHDTFRGVTLASLAAALGVAVTGIISAGSAPEQIFSSLFVTGFVFLPLIVLFVPFNAMLRWSSHQLLPHKNNDTWALRSWPRLRSVLAWTFLAGLVGSFSLYPHNAQQMMHRMVDLIEMTQNRSDSIPFEFTKYKTTIQAASRDYTIEWSDNLRAFPEPLFFDEARTALRLQVVTVRFSSGHSLYCLFREIDRNIYLCTMRDKRPFSDSKAVTYGGVAWYSQQLNQTVNNLLATPAAHKP